MFRACCLRKDETAETLPREVLYRRYFMFYVVFHAIYFVISVIEYFYFRNEKFAILYFGALFMLFLDCMNNGIILLTSYTPEKCLIFMTIAAVVTLLIYTISRLEAYLDIDSDGEYLITLTLLYMIFFPIKLRYIYHTFRFMRFSGEKKKQLLLAGVDFEDLSKTGNNLNDSGIDNLILGTGPIDYQRMNNNDDDDDNDNYNNNNRNNNDNGNNYNHDEYDDDEFNNDAMRSNFMHSSQQSQSSQNSDHLGITNVSNLNFQDIGSGQRSGVSSLHSSQHSQGSTFLDTQNFVNLSSINENREISQSHGSSHHNDDIIDLNDVNIDKESRLQASFGTNQNSVIIHSTHSTQSSMSGFSSSTDRIGSYVPRLDDAQARMDGSVSSSDTRPRTLSQKYPGFVAIK